MAYKIEFYIEEQDCCALATVEAPKSAVAQNRNAVDRKKCQAFRRAAKNK